MTTTGINFTRFAAGPRRFVTVMPTVGGWRVSTDVPTPGMLGGEAFLAGCQQVHDSLTDAATDATNRLLRFGVGNALVTVWQALLA